MATRLAIASTIIDRRPRMNKFLHRIAVGCAFVLVALAGCETAPRSAATASAGAAEPQRHIIRSAELRRLMQRLEALTADRVQAELALDVKRNETADALADVAGELAAAASSLAVDAVTASLDEAGRQQFRLHALELQREAEILRATAAEHRFIASVDQFQRLNHVCAGCHSLYRAR
jgi:cytochrome c556